MITLSAYALIKALGTSWPICRRRGWMARENRVLPRGSLAPCCTPYWLLSKEARAVPLWKYLRLLSKEARAVPLWKYLRVLWQL